MKVRSASLMRDAIPGIVSGSLLVTPKVVMFNPSLNDPLVQENDPDSYQLVTPAELIVNFAILR